MFQRVFFPLSFALIVTVSLSLGGCLSHPNRSESTDSSESAPPSDDTELETKNFVEGEGGAVMIYVEPNIHSKEDLDAFKAAKRAETEKILEMTEEQSQDTPYYPAIITMNQPVSLADLSQLLAKHNPSVATAMRSTTVSNRSLPKVELQPGEDTLLKES